MAFFYSLPVLLCTHGLSRGATCTSQSLIQTLSLAYVCKFHASAVAKLLRTEQKKRRGEAPEGESLLACWLEDPVLFGPMATSLAAGRSDEPSRALPDLVHFVVSDKIQQQRSIFRSSTPLWTANTSAFSSLVFCVQSALIWQPD